MRLRWMPEAADDLEAIQRYLLQHRPALAQPTVQKLYAGIRRLRRMPYQGRSGRREGTRELVFAPLPYIAVYRVKEDVVEVLHIYHGAQNRPSH